MPELSTNDDTLVQFLLISWLPVIQGRKHDDYLISLASFA